MARTQSRPTDSRLYRIVPRWQVPAASRDSLGRYRDTDRREHLDNRQSSRPALRPPYVPAWDFSTRAIGQDRDRIPSIRASPRLG